MNNEPLILGLDGGGTGTTAWLARLDDGRPDTVARQSIGDSQSIGDPHVSRSEQGMGKQGMGTPQVLGRGAAGPSNARAAGLEVAARNIVAAIEQAFQDAGIRPRQVLRACLAMAGADREEDRQRLFAWAEQAGFAQRVRIVNDGLPVLYAAHPQGLGVALIAGTGSFCLGKDRLGRVVRSGGWGYLLGDEGSAYWIALQALQSVARAADRRGPETELRSVALAYFGCSHPSELILKVYDAKMDRPRLAGFTQHVFETAEQGDALARSIVDAASDHLLEMVESVIRQLEFDETAPTLAVTGGVLLNQPTLVARLQTGLQQRETQGSRERTSMPWSVVRVPDPVIGALRMAASHDG